MMSVSELYRCIVESHDLSVTILKTQAGSVEWHKDMSCMAWLTDFNKVLRVLSDEPTLLNLGFVHNTLSEEDAEYEDEVAYASFLWKFA
eukprot:3655135-Amphidinium_carterae.1